MIIPARVLNFLPALFGVVKSLGVPDKGEATNFFQPFCMPFCILEKRVAASSAFLMGSARLGFTAVASSAARRAIFSLL